MIFTVTPIYALAVAVIYMTLWMRVTAKRGKMGQSIGEGGDLDILLRVRQHGNCAEWSSFLLILMILAEDGAMVLPERQNRALWDARAMKEGRELLLQAVQRGRPGPFQIKAAIADCHMAEKKPDWQQISLLYGSLWAHEPTPVVALNWAVVMAELGQLELALRKINDLKAELNKFQPHHAAHASILAKVGHIGEAKVAYERAIDLA